MIGLKDTITLALTKLRTKRMRTTVTVIVSGVLFGVLIGLLIIAEGGFQSAKRFNEVGLGGRYFVQASHLDNVGDELSSSPAVQKRTQEIYQTTIANKKAEAERLGISYDPGAEIEPVKTYGSGNSYLDLSSPAAQEALEEYRQTHPGINLSDLKRTAEPYNPAAFYSMQGLKPANGSIELMRNGEESFSPIGGPDDFLAKGPLRVLDSSITASFILPDASKGLAPGNRNAIPIIVPYSVAEQQLDLQPLPSDASSRQKLNRLKELRDKAADITFSACYRNSISQQQIDSAIQAAANEDNRQQPITHGLPEAGSCAAATVIDDTRTEAQKLLDERRKEFNKQFGGVVVSEQEKITFRVVGLVPDDRQGAPINNPAEFFQSFVGPSFLGAPTIPKSMYLALPGIERYQEIFTLTNLLPSIDSYLVEFNDLNDAKRFISEQSCEPTQSTECPATDRPFTLTPFGSNSIALAGLQDTLFSASKIAIAVIVVIAMIIMSGTIGRIIADERRETAVFRAIGATRLDIASIYLTYTLFLSLLVAGFAILLGMATAYFFDLIFWQQATVQAQLAYGIIDTAREIRFFTLNVPQIWLVAAAAVLTGMASVLLPLQHNLGRSPINDIRDE